MGNQVAKAEGKKELGHLGITGCVALRAAVVFIFVILGRSHNSTVSAPGCRLVATGRMSQPW